ncbi:MAG: hypothetical protein Q9208_000869 [Pyrenodesmia sp. 3 TL-2023]
MGSSLISFEKTVHQLPCSNLTLLTRCRLGVGLRNIPISHQSSQEPILAGLWITRGNGLHLSVRLELDAYAALDIQPGNFTDGVGDILCAAKVLHPALSFFSSLICPDIQLWFQLSLKASRADSTTTDVPFCSPSDFVLALSYLESSSISTQSNKYGLSLPANIHDVTPPPGVSTASLDSIELTFTVQALLPSPASPVKNRGCKFARERNIGNKERYPLRLRNAVSYEEDSDTSPPLLPAANEEVVHEDILLESQSCDMPTHDTEMLKLNEDHFDMLLYPDPRPMPAIPNVSLPKYPQYTQHPQPPPLGLSILKLVDASLRHTISGTPAPSKTTAKGAPSDVRLTKTSPSPSLADISPALFRPGYLKAIAARAPLISRIASSLATIAARSLIHPLSSEPEPSPPLSTSELQPQLWRLLQKRKWPTSPLEPLDCGDASIFERHAGDEIIMSDSEDPRPEASNPYTNSPRAKIKEDMDMLDCHTPLHFGDGTMLEADKGDEDLFSSLESTPFSSQDSGGDEMILEEEEEGEEDLLLNEADSSYLFGTREVVTVPWLQDERVRDADLREESFDGYVGSESDDGALQMLF